MERRSQIVPKAGRSSRIRPLLKRLNGPYVECMIGHAGDMIHRRNPDVVRVPMNLMTLLIPCYEQADPFFDFYGCSVYTGNSLRRLIRGLRDYIAALCACRWKQDFRALLNNPFLREMEETADRWGKDWRRLRGELALFVEKLLQQAMAAQRYRQLLYFRGI